jgi:hypothetical protein
MLRVSLERWQGKDLGLRRDGSRVKVGMADDAVRPTQSGQNNDENVSLCSPDPLLVASIGGG